MTYEIHNLCKSIHIYSSSCVLYGRAASLGFVTVISRTALTAKLYHMYCVVDGVTIQ